MQSPWILLKSTFSPMPSANPLVCAFPANVVTSPYKSLDKSTVEANVPCGVILRIVCDSSATYKSPVLSLTAIAVGLKKLASVPLPSLCPLAGVPANTLTLPS